MERDRALFWARMRSDKRLKKLHHCSEDFGRFQVCLSGATVSHEDLDCQDAKLDGDLDVDQDDFGIFQGCISGPNIPGDPHCADG